MRLLIVDDHQVVRLGLRAVLAAETEVEVVGEAATAAEAIEMTGRLRPDLVLMDVRLPDRSGIHACREIRRRRPESQVLMLTSFADSELVMSAIDAGAAGYVLKSLDSDDLLRAVRAVGRGDATIDPAVTREVLARVRRAYHTETAAAFRDLTERELHVLAIIAQGKTNAGIAEELVLSEKTVRNHVSAILGKLGVTNRIEAATYAVRNHIERHAPESEGQAGGQADPDADVRDRS